MSRRLVDSVTIHTSAYAEGVTRNNVSASRRTAVLDLNADHELAVLGAPHKAYSKIGYYLLRNQVVYTLALHGRKHGNLLADNRPGRTNIR